MHILNYLYITLQPEFLRLTTSAMLLWDEWRPGHMLSPYAINGFGSQILNLSIEKSIYCLCIGPHISVAKWMVQNHLYLTSGFNNLCSCHTCPNKRVSSSDITSLQRT